uniref:Uncharacterized protein n=1 Tax=Ditylum brightwellii TaxID=49249 RepID=A0A6S9C9Y2_9STRA
MRTSRLSSAYKPSFKRRDKSFIFTLIFSLTKLQLDDFALTSPQLMLLDLVPESPRAPVALKILVTHPQPPTHSLDAPSPLYPAASQVSARESKQSKDTSTDSVGVVPQEQAPAALHDQFIKIPNLV